MPPRTRKKKDEEEDVQAEQLPAEDEEQDEEQDEEFDDEEAAEESEEQVPGNVSINVGEDYLQVELPRDGSEGKRLQTIAKLVGDM